MIRAVADLVLVRRSENYAKTHNNQIRAHRYPSKAVACCSYARDHYHNNRWRTFCGVRVLLHVRLLDSCNVYKYNWTRCTTLGFHGFVKRLYHHPRNDRFYLFFQRYADMRHSHDDEPRLMIRDIGVRAAPPPHNRSTSTPGRPDTPFSLLSSGWNCLSRKERRDRAVALTSPISRFGAESLLR